jgi:hypothetical protein
MPKRCWSRLDRRMAKQTKEITDELMHFIKRPKIFFVATAELEGRVNVSPKGMDSLRVLAPDKVIWLNLTGSGNETAAHVLENRRMAIMFCAFNKKPLILRLYGEADIIHPGDAGWREYIGLFPETTGARQVFDMRIDLVQTSCGYAVPFFDYVSDRDVLLKWAAAKGEKGIQEYWREKNQLSIDGKPTNIVMEK